MLKSVAIHFMKTRTLVLCSFSKALTCEHTRDGTSPFIILIIELRKVGITGDRGHY